MYFSLYLLSLALRSSNSSVSSFNCSSNSLVSKVPPSVGVAGALATATAGNPDWVPLSSLVAAGEKAVFSRATSSSTSGEYQNKQHHEHKNTKQTHTVYIILCDLIVPATQSKERLSTSVS